MKKLQTVMAFVVVAGLFALWAARSNTGVLKLPRASSNPKSNSEPASVGSVPSKPASVLRPGAASAPPVEKTPPLPGSEAPAHPSEELRKRIAALKQNSRDPGEIELEAIRATADYLSIQPALRSGFEVEARHSLLEVELAMATLKGDLAGLAQKGSSQAAGSDARRLAEARYAAARRNALDRLQPFLSGSTNAKQFQWGFETWAATVRAQPQQVHPVSGGN